MLFPNLLLITVIKAVALVPKPDADRYRQAKGMCLIQEFTDPVSRPGTNRIAARSRELLQERAATGSFYEVRLAAAQQLPALFGLSELNWYGLGHDAPAKQKGPCQ